VFVLSSRVFPEKAMITCQNQNAFYCIHLRILCDILNSMISTKNSTIRISLMFKEILTINRVISSVFEL